MQFKQKLAYIALGGVLVIIGQLLPNILVSRVVAQGKATSAEFDTVTCRSLKVVDEAGKVRAQLEVIKRLSVAPVDDVIQVFNQSGVSVYRTGVTSNGGAVDVYSNDNEARVVMSIGIRGGIVAIANDKGQPVAMMSTNIDNGGSVSIKGNDGKERAVMTVLPDGGSVIVNGNDGELRAMMTVLPDGGSVSIKGNDGKERAVIGVSEKDSGSLQVIGKDSKGSAQIYVNEYGGVVSVFGIDSDKSRAVMGVNEYGSGAISTWDKNGYRIR